MSDSWSLPPLARAGPPCLEALPGLEGVDPVRLAAALGDACPAVLTSDGSPRERWHVLGLAPRGWLQSRQGRTELTWDGLPAPARWEGLRGLDALRALLRAACAPRPVEGVPLAGGLIALLSYDLAHEIERLPATTEDRDGLPWLVAAACPACVLLPAAGGEGRLAFLPAGGGPGLAWGLEPHEAEGLRVRVRRAVEAAGPLPHGAPVGEVEALVAVAEYREMVRRVHEHLLAGDVYQANVSQRLEVGWRGSTLPLFAELRRANPSPQSGWLRVPASGVGPAWELCCNSPERLVRLVGRELATEPIAGTLPLPLGPGSSPEQVAEATARLRASVKDAAEHVMIVDLHRNDLGRVAEGGTVRVAETMRVDRRTHLVQAVADIRGTLAPGRDAVDVVEALLPGGCITGVPKIRCMEILDEVERFRRGPYTGSLGMFAPWGDLDLNVVIRSAWRVGERLAFAAGGGIVLDSDADREHAESVAKARGLLSAIETVREAAGAGGSVLPSRTPAPPELP